MNRTAEIEFMMEIWDDFDSDPNDYLFQELEYQQEDEARLKAWKHDEWRFFGIRAKALIKIPYGSNPACWITTELRSPGLWGVESDAGNECFEEIFEEERAVLVE